MLTDDAIRALAEEIWRQRTRIARYQMEREQYYRGGDEFDSISDFKEAQDDAIREVASIIRRHLSQPDAGGDMARAVELLRQWCGPCVLTSQTHYSTMKDRTDAFLASIGGKA